MSLNVSSPRRFVPGALAVHALAHGQNGHGLGLTLDMFANVASV